MYHAWVESGTWSVAYFGDVGVHAEVNRYSASRSCKRIQTNLVKVASMLQTEKVKQDASGNWDPSDYSNLKHNCWHYVNTLITAAGSAKNALQYFPEHNFIVPGIE